MSNLTQNKVEKSIKVLFLVYLFFLPLHYLLFNVILSSYSFLKIWKEIVIIILIFLTLLLLKNNSNFLSKYKFPNIFSALCGVFVLISIIYFFVSPFKIAALNILRVYLIPIILYFIAKNIKFTDNDLKFGFNILSIEASLISLYAVFQSLFLGSQFLINIGYPIRENGRLSTSFYLSGFGDFQRVAGTLVSSNTFAFFISIFFIICLYTLINKDIKNDKTKMIIIFTLISSLIGLFFSFSRSSWLATFITSLLIMVDSQKKGKLNISYTKICKCFFGLLILGIILIALLSILSKNNFFSLIIEYALNTIKFKDTSALSHISSYIKSFQVFLNNVFGTGLGINGPKAAAYFNQFYHTESSYFLILFDFGIIGFLIYYSIYFFVPVKYYFQNLDIGLANYLFVFALIAFIFLPYVQDFEIISYLFVVLGLSISKISNLKNQKINILFLHSSSEFYGSDKSLYNLVVNLNNNENMINKVYVILPTRGILKTKIENASKNTITINCHNVGVLRRKNFNLVGIIRYFIEYIESFIYLLYYIDKNNINVVYTNTSVVMPGGLAAKVLSVKNIWHIRETLDKNSFVNRVIIKYITFLSDSIIANSQSTLDNFLLKPFKNSHVVYNAVEPIKTVSPKFVFKNKDFVIGMAGRINSWKGQEIFIEAASKIKNKLNSQFNIMFLIAGDAYSGDEYLVKNLNDKIRMLGMEDEIRLLGQVNEMDGFYNSIDIFVLPSTKPEPFGLVIIEAMSLGIPVVASNMGGPLEIIDDNIDGMLFESKSSDDLCDHIVKLILNKDIYNFIGKNAVEKQRNVFSIDNNYKSIYKIIIGG